MDVDLRFSNLAKVTEAGSGSANAGPQFFSLDSVFFVGGLEDCLGNL